jgi:hypothetical protein
MRPICLLPVFVLACDIAEDRFGDEVAERWCARQKACDEDAFFDAWLLGTPDCRDAVSDEVDDHRYGNGDAACTYDPDLAKACVDQVEAATCEALLASNFVDHCSQDVWDCIAIVNPGSP